MLGRIRREEGAQGIVEFALMMPFLFILVFGIIDFGNGLKTYITVNAAAREAARSASIGNQGTTSGSFVLCNTSGLSTSNPVAAKACGTMGGLNASRASVEVTCDSSCTSGQTATIATKYSYKYITPIKGLISLFSGGSLSDLNISASTSMRIE